MRKTLCVFVLVLALGCPAFAGIIHNPAPQPTPSITQEAAADGEIYYPPAAETVGETVLSLIQSVLTLF